MKAIKIIAFLFTALLIIFTPVFLFFPKWTWLVAFLGGATLFNYNFRRKYGLFSKPMVFTILMLLSSLLLSVVIPILFETYDFNYTLLIIGLFLSILRMFFLLFVYEKFFKNWASLNSYIFYFLLTCVLYVFISLIFIFNIDIKLWWFDNVIEPVKIVDWGTYSYRVGIDGFAAFSTASVFSLAVIFNSYLLSQKQANKLKYILLIGSYFIILVGCFIYGRVSIASIFLSLYFLIYSARNIFKFIKITSFVIGAVMMLISYLLTLAESNLELAKWIEWSFELFFVFFDTGKIGGQSFEHMVNDMYFIPPFRTLFFGDGLYESESGYYLSTDVGFMRSVLFFGIIGALFNYLALLGILINIRNKFNLFHNRNGVVLTYLIICSFLILESKGEAFHRILYLSIPVYCLIYKERYLQLSD